MEQMDTKYEIFISYKRVDKERVFKIKENIEKGTGKQCWIDLDGIESDAQFINVIMRAINNCSIFLFMYSQAHSAIYDYEQDWTVREISFAQKKKKRIVFINLDGSKLTDWFEFMFGTKQQINSLESDAMKHLHHDIVKWLASKESKVTIKQSTLPKDGTSITIGTTNNNKNIIKKKSPTEIDDTKLTPYIQKGKIGFVNEKTKELIIPCKYNNVYQFSENLAPVKVGSKWGFIDKKGKEIIPSKYDYAHKFIKGLALIQYNNKYGFIDTTGKEVIPCTYDNLWFFSEELAPAAKDGKWGFIDKQGKKIIPYIYDNLWYFSEGLAPIAKNGKWGFIDKKGKEVIPCIYDYANGFSEGLAAVLLNGKYAFIDKSGKKVIEHKFNKAKRFVEGLALVYKHFNYGFIDKTGKEVIKCKYEYSSEFSDGVAAVKQYGRKCKLIDKTEKELFQSNYNYIEKFHEGLANVYNGKYGFIDKKGKEIIPCKYDKALKFIDGLAAVELKGRKGFIDKFGNCTLN